MKTRLFNEEDTYTEEGRALAGALADAIGPILEAFIPQYDRRDIENIAIAEANMGVISAYYRLKNKTT